MDAGLVAFLGVAATLIGTSSAYLLARRAQPSVIAQTQANTANLEVNSVAAWQKMYSDLQKMFDERTDKLQQAVIEGAAAAHILGAEQAKALMAANSALEAANLNNSSLIASNTKLMADVDGMPDVISKKTANQLLQANYILVQRDALTAAGISLADQPVEPPSLPEGKLTPENLLDILAPEKKARQATNIVIDPTPKGGGL